MNTITSKLRALPAWLVITAVVVAPAALTFGILRGIHNAQTVEERTGSVVSYSQREYQYQCGQVGGDASKGMPGTPIFCDGTEYPTHLDVNGEAVNVTYSDEPATGGYATVWHIDNSSWSSVNPHGADGILLDAVWAFAAAVLAGLVCLGVVVLRY